MNDCCRDMYIKGIIEGREQRTDETAKEIIDLLWETELCCQASTKELKIILSDVRKKYLGE